MKFQRAFVLLLAIFLLANLPACDKEEKSDLATTQMTIGDKDYTLEIAATDHEKEVGLMHRESLPEDHGMIFPWQSEESRSFWNHDVHFGLDLLFLDAGGTVIDIKQMEAYSEKNVDSDGPSQYVIELNEGSAEKLHVEKGTRLALPKDVLPVHVATKP